MLRFLKTQMAAKSASVKAGTRDEAWGSVWECGARHGNARRNAGTQTQRADGGRCAEMREQGARRRNSGQGAGRWKRGAGTRGVARGKRRAAFPLAQLIAENEFRAVRLKALRFPLGRKAKKNAPFLHATANNRLPPRVNHSMPRNLLPGIKLRLGNNLPRWYEVSCFFKEGISRLYSGDDGGSVPFARADVLRNFNAVIRPDAGNGFRKLTPDAIAADLKKLPVVPDGYTNITMNGQRRGILAPCGLGRFFRAAG